MKTTRFQTNNSTILLTITEFGVRSAVRVSQIAGGWEVAATSEVPSCPPYTYVLATEAEALAVLERIEAALSNDDDDDHGMSEIITDLPEFADESGTLMRCSPSLPQKFRKLVEERDTARDTIARIREKVSEMNFKMRAMSHEVGGYL